MSNSILGNNGEPEILLAWYEVEVDEDEYEDIEGELVDEKNVFGYRALVPKKSNSTSVTIFYYYTEPTSEWYWDYNYGIQYSPVIPVVFAADSSWNLTECLNSSFAETSLTGLADGWLSMNVTLKRKLVEGERIVFGFYSDLAGYVATEEAVPGTTMSYLYWSRAKRSNYSSQIAYISSADFISQQKNISSDYEMCIYMQYENEPDGIAYSCSVLGNVGAVAAFSNRSLASYRAMENTTALVSSAGRRLLKIISERENVGFTDIVGKLLLIIRSCFSTSDIGELVERKADYKKEICIFIENEERVSRWGENYRSFENKALINERPYASRIFYRACQTVMAAWDWLRGKIREANNVITLFCPIHIEITMECKI